MVNQKTTFLIVLAAAILIVLVFVFANLVTAGGNDGLSSGGPRKHKSGKSKGQAAQVVKAIDLRTPVARTPTPFEQASKLQRDALAASGSSPHVQAYPLKNDYRLIASGALVSLRSIAVTSTGIIFAIDVSNDLLFSVDTGRTFNKVYLAASDSAVDQLVDLAYDALVDTLSILRNESAGSESSSDAVMRQRIDTFSVDALLQSSPSNTVKTRWQSLAQQPNGNPDVVLQTNPLTRNGVRRSGTSNDTVASGGPRDQYSSIAYDLDGNLYALYQTGMQQTDVYSVDQRSGASAFKGPLDSAILKLMFDPRKSDTRYLNTSYCVTNTLYRADNSLALVDNSTGDVDAVKPADSQQRSVLNGQYQSIAGSPTLLYVVKANRLYHVVQYAV